MVVDDDGHSVALDPQPELASSSARRPGRWDRGRDASPPRPSGATAATASTRRSPPVDVDSTAAHDVGPSPSGRSPGRSGPSCWGSGTADIVSATAATSAAAVTPRSPPRSSAAGPTTPRPGRPARERPRPSRCWSRSRATPGTSCTPQPVAPAAPEGQLPPRRDRPAARRRSIADAPAAGGPARAARAGTAEAATGASAGRPGEPSRTTPHPGERRPQQPQSGVVAQANAGAIRSGGWRRSRPAPGSSQGRHHPIPTVAVTATDRHERSARVRVASTAVPNATSPPQGVSAAGGRPGRPPTGAGPSVDRTWRRRRSTAPRHTPAGWAAGRAGGVRRHRVPPRQHGPGDGRRPALGPKEGSDTGTGQDRHGEQHEELLHTGRQHVRERPHDAVQWPGRSAA